MSKAKIIVFCIGMAVVIGHYIYNQITTEKSLKECEDEFRKACSEENNMVEFEDEAE